MEEVKIKEFEEDAKTRRLVLPGDEIGHGTAGSGSYIDKGSVISKVVGLSDKKGDIHFVIPLSGVYNPRRGDGVIGIIIDIVASKWIVDINSPYTATISLSEAVNEFIDLTKNDLTRYYDFNDIIFAKVMSVSKTKSVSLTMKDKQCRKLYNGVLVKVTPTKVPRIIGRRGSMVEMIKKKTQCQIVVGQNGIVWIRGENRQVAVESIIKIDEYAHTVGLTNKIEEFLDKRIGGNK